MNIDVFWPRSVWPGTNWDRKLLGCFELLSLLWFWKIRGKVFKAGNHKTGGLWLLTRKKGRNSSLCTSGRLIWSCIGRSHPWRELLSISSCLFREKSMNILSLHIIGINVSNLQLMPRSTCYYHYGNGLHNGAILLQQWVISSC